MQTDIAVKSTCLVLRNGAQLDPALLGDYGGGYHIHIRIGGFHDTRNRGAVQRLEVHILNQTIIGHLDGGDRLFGQLTHKGAKVFRQFDPRPHDAGFFGAD